MNLPNKLTMLRILMIPVFVVLALQTGTALQIAALVVFLLASFTDFLDGQIARKNNLVTDFGKFADPIADKLLVMSALVVFVGQARMPSWTCILMLAREFIISGFRLVAAGSGKVIAAGWLGKVKTVSQMAAIVLLLLFVPVGGAEFAANVGTILANVALYFATFMTVWSGADYIVRNFDCIKDM